MYRALKEDKLIETVEQLRKRISDRFPDSGLSRVADELVQVTRESVERAASIRRPNFWLRGGLVVIALLALGGILWHFVSSPDFKTAVQDSIGFLDAAKGVGLYLVAIAAFLITLEFRFKRRKALRAIHELRAMAHLIDMHQLNKDTERLGTPEGPTMENGRLMTADEVGRYLHSCSQLLAILSKVAQLYVQDFPDATAETAVDHFEGLATGLSGKIWQKIMILDRFHTTAGTAACPRPEPVADGKS